jgi:hypothetical protein
MWGLMWGYVREDSRLKDQKPCQAENARLVYLLLITSQSLTANLELSGSLAVKL